MNPIFLVVGPPAVGKSTTSRALAARFPKSLHIPVDAVREMVVSGLALPSAEWSDALIEQLRLARTSAAQMALNYQQAGFAVVIDDFWDTNLPSDYQALDSDAAQRILLIPAQTEAHERNRTRSGDSPARGYIDEGIRIVYQQLNGVIPHLAQSGWLVLDTTTLGVDAVVETIIGRG